jgi:hypothetical protein
MRRREMMLLLVPAIAAAEEGRARVRGKLGKDGEGRPVLLAEGGGEVRLTGDEDTMGVLRDERVIGSEFELVGERGQGGVFVVDPIHKKAMFVVRGGKRLFVTYWCDICSIRTYTPGKCWCCQEETELDIRERYDQ